MISGQQPPCGQKTGDYPLGLNVPGRHNIHNAAGAFAAAQLTGLEPEQILAGLAAFNGTMRRFPAGWRSCRHPRL